MRAPVPGVAQHSDGRVTVVALAIALGSLAASVALCPSVETAVPALAVLAGLGGGWLQAAHPPYPDHGHDTALVALLVV